VEVYYGNVSKTLGERVKMQSDYKQKMADLEEVAEKVGPLFFMSVLFNL
jgi:hypothetical protein